MQTGKALDLSGLSLSWKMWPQIMHMSRGQHEEHGEGSSGRPGPMSRGGHRNEESSELDPRGRYGKRSHHGGPHVGRGDVRAAILLLLAEQPSHGYQLIQQVSERSGGFWQPSPGSVYPALQLLEDEGLVSAESQEGRRVFRLTEAGQVYTQERQDELRAIWQVATNRVNNKEQELHQLMHQLGDVVRQVAHVGTTTQIAATRDLLTKARRQLYLILAGDSSETDHSEK